MSGIYSKEFKKKYLKSKIKLRQWENEFLAQNGRLPTKDDIKASPTSVKEHYKIYWKLKIQILEAQICGENKLTEEVPNLNRSKLDSVLKEHTNVIECYKKGEDAHNFLVESSKENISTPESKNSYTKTWGTHLNKSQIVSVVEKEKCTFLNETIAGRLFKGSSFKKRNPRKSLSFSKKQSNKSVNSEENSLIMSPYSDSQNDMVDQSLNGSVFSAESNCTPNIKALITSSVSLLPLLSKPDQTKLLKEQTIVPVQPVSLIQLVASDPSVVLKSGRNLDAGWVNRCAQVDNSEERKSLDSGFESLEFSQLLEKTQVDNSSDDDIIVGSDNEIDENSKLSCSFVGQKRKPTFSPSQFTNLVEEKNFENAQQPYKKIKLDTITDQTKPKTKEEIKKAILEKKMQKGKLNENFVQINLKKKVFVRGKKNFNFARYKKREWKNKKKNLEDEKESGVRVRCYKCGMSGHFSKHCHKGSDDKLLEINEDGIELPTLEEAEKMAKEKLEEHSFKKINVLTLKKPQEENILMTKVEPLYNLNDDKALLEIPFEVYEALHKFGHQEFRPGQKETIMRILCGQSTLLITATGGGKSLCYQLPAYLYASRNKCITLVVSPLVSLMEDQVSGSSSFFKVGCLHTGQTEKQREAVVQDAKKGKLYALLVSPEALVSGDLFGLSNIFRQLPPIAFACIDEVHCISQWSHNFRPSYLMISKVLKEKLGITTVLGLTATATLSTINSITAELGINREEGVIKDIPLPNNLCLSVSRDENKDEALIQLLKSPRFKDANAVLIYCTRRDECERLAVFIRTRLQDPVLKNDRSSKSLSWNAESYHAGMAVARRKQVQKAFMRGNLRIIVATVAFGMGINKQDIRGVIHYNMPKDIESYVQEVGRAGRDGMLAYCHLFLDSTGRDLNELRRHIHSDSVDRYVLRKLLQRVFIECGCKEKKKSCEEHEIAFNCQDTIQALDIPEENIHTLLCYLELNEKRFIQVLTPIYVNCKIKSYKGIKEIISAAKKCPPLAYACALKTKKIKSGILEFDVVEVANKLSWDSSLVKNQLKSIEWEVTKDGKWRKTGISVEFYGLGFRVCSRGDMTPSELDEALNYLIQRVENQEKKANTHLDITFSIFDYFAKDNFSCCLENFDESSSRNLKGAILKYFEGEELCNEIPMKQFKVETFDEEIVAADARTLICTYRDITFNGRAIARIFHGIQSPNYPASFWYKCKFWRKHVEKDFNKISRLATVEILRLKV